MQVAMFSLYQPGLLLPVCLIEPITESVVMHATCRPTVHFPVFTLLRSLSLCTGTILPLQGVGQLNVLKIPLRTVYIASGLKIKLKDFSMNLKNQFYYFQ